MLVAEDDCVAVAGSQIAMSFDGVVAGGVRVEASDFCLCNWGIQGMVVVLGTGVEAVGLDSTLVFVVRGLEFAVEALEGLGTLEDLDTVALVSLELLVGLVVVETGRLVETERLEVGETGCLEKTGRLDDGETGCLEKTGGLDNGETGRLEKTGRLDVDEAVCLDALVGRDSGEPVVDDSLVVEEAVGLEL